MRLLSDSDKPAVPNDPLDQLEQGLREVLTTVNLDFLLNIGAQPAADANRHLKALCYKLEGLVNPLLVPPDTLPVAGQAASSYTRLKALIRILQRDNWQFDLVVGDQPDRTFFQVRSEYTAMSANRIVDELNRFFKTLYQPSLREMATQQKLEVDQEELDRALRLHNSLKAPFEKLLQKLQESSPDVTKDKQVLVQLVDSGHSTREPFHLFLSSYKHGKSWLEVQLESAPPE